MAEGKWHGAVSDVIPAPIEKVWPILADFGGLREHFPQIFESSEIVEGERNKVGALRVLTGPLPDGSKVVASERLLTVDDVNHTTTYTVEKINLGWTGYAGRIAAKRLENGETLVEWTFDLDPCSGQTKEEFLSNQQGLLQLILTLTKGLFAQ